MHFIHQMQSLFRVSTSQDGYEDVHWNSSSSSHPPWLRFHLGISRWQLYPHHDPNMEPLMQQLATHRIVSTGVIFRFRVLCFSFGRSSKRLFIMLSFCCYSTVSMYGYSRAWCHMLMMMCHSWGVRQPWAGCFQSSKLKHLSQFLVEVNKLVC